MTILGIETSCDETSAAIVESNLESKTNRQTVKILSNIVSSSLSLHAITGGIIPEVAAREQVKYIIPVIKKALDSARGVDAQNPVDSIDAIAVTIGPGLIGSLLVGTETAKVLSYIWKKPLIAVNHLLGHIYANWLTINNQKQASNIEFPALALIASGGHTDLVIIKKHGNIKWLGGTRDDAAGEAFDKIARLLGLPYPGGPVIEKLSQKGNEKAFNFPRPMIDSTDFDFSFSGLKAAVAREVKKISAQQKTERLNETITADIAASVQKAIIEVLISKTLKAAQEYKIKSILLGGGVACNQKLRDEFQLSAKHYMPNAKIFVPQKSLCTDNAAMVAAAAAFNYKEVSWQKLNANPELYFD